MYEQVKTSWIPKIPEANHEYENLKWQNTLCWIQNLPLLGGGLARAPQNLIQSSTDSYKQNIPQPMAW